MNDTIQNFIEELKGRPAVMGVILFGSWARGNSRPDSDVDLVVIMSYGYQRTVEQRDGQIFEIVYTTADTAFKYWVDHKNAAANLWEVAQILFDRDGRVAKLRDAITGILAQGKRPTGEDATVQLKFDAEDQLRYIENVADMATANLMLSNKVYALTGLFFDMRGLWTPPPKQRLSGVAKEDGALHRLLVDFYADDSLFAERLWVAKQIVAHMFDGKQPETPPASP